MIKNHLLEIANQVKSPNYNDRPDCMISLVVIHNISLPPGKYDNLYIEDFFTNKLDSNKHTYFKTIKDVKVSSHLLIKRNGEIIQFVPFNKRAWHAGESNYKGTKNCNDFSIGIELQGTDTEKYMPEQYESLNRIIKILRLNYPIKDVVGHSEISPTRKTDPGKSFDWSKLT